MCPPGNVYLTTLIYLINLFNLICTDYFSASLHQVTDSSVLVILVQCVLTWRGTPGMPKHMGTHLEPSTPHPPPSTPFSTSRPPSPILSISSYKHICTKLLKFKVCSGRAVYLVICLYHTLLLLLS